MFFRAQNLGPLRDAEVDLSKDLIVLAGPNNAGKTYLAWSVYALHHTSVQLDGPREDWAQRLLAAPNYSLPIRDLVGEDWPSVLEEISRQCSAKLHLCFATREETFATAKLTLQVDRVNTSKTEVVPSSLTDSTTPVLFSYNDGKVHLILIDIADMRASVETIYKDTNLPPSWQEKTRSKMVGLSEEDRRALPLHIWNMLQPLIQGTLLPECILFPAERIAVNIFAKELTINRTALVDELLDAELGIHPGKSLELLRRNAGRYPWPIRDSLKVANDLANLSKNKSRFADLADELERSILGGAVNVSEHGELLFTPADVPAARLAMHLTASVVKSLTSLVLRMAARHAQLSKMPAVEYRGLIFSPRFSVPKGSLQRMRCKYEPDPGGFLDLPVARYADGAEYPLSHVCV